MNGKTTTLAILTLAALMIPPPTRAETSWRPQLLERDQEIAEALAAGPELVRDGAGVYVLTESGYDLVRESTNGFHCIVSRSQPDAFEPQCFDAAGTDSLLQATLLMGELQMQGLAPGRVKERIQQAWDEGRLRAPARPGINYMLSEKNRVPISPDKVVPYGPHLMFYAPDLNNEVIGGDPTGRKSPIFMINQNRPSGYVIVPVGAH